MIGDVTTVAQLTISGAERVNNKVQQTSCCIIGGGPAGAMLALLLARQGIPVTLLEAQKDFDRDFRSDTIHPAIMEALHDIGLAERLLELRHTKMRYITFVTEAGSIPMSDFAYLKTRYPFITLMPQPRFLDFLIAEAQRYPHFRVVMGARVEELLEENGQIYGVRYREDNELHEVRAPLTVGADGRFSKIRKLAGMTPVTLAPKMDVLWMRLPPGANDPPPDAAFLRVGKGKFAILFDRFEYWQVGYNIPPGSFGELRSAGIEKLRRLIAEALPEFADRVHHLEDWKQITLLSVAGSRLSTWHRPGLLLIGDAAHTMSPIGAVGINMAVQDAIVAANVLASPLKSGSLCSADLARVQRKRQMLTQIVQKWQTTIQQKVIAASLDPDKPFKVPLLLKFLTRTPIVRTLPTRLIGLGLFPARVKL